MGPGAGELIAEATLAIEMGCVVRDIAETHDPSVSLDTVRAYHFGERFLVASLAVERCAALRAVLAALKDDRCRRVGAVLLQHRRRRLREPLHQPLRRRVRTARHGLRERLSNHGARGRAGVRGSVPRRWSP